MAGLAMCCCTIAYGADIQAGKTVAARCAVCHGANGIATAPDAPNLAGQNAMYLAKALRDFQSGARENEVMSVMAKGLSDADIENLAAYFQDIKIKVEGQQ
jgi:cytochrome c553